MSVVGSDWEGLKRFNLAELYNTHKKPTAKVDTSNGEAKPEVVKTGELAAPPSTVATITDSSEP